MDDIVKLNDFIFFFNFDTKNTFEKMRKSNSKLFEKINFTIELLF